MASWPILVREVDNRTNGPGADRNADGFANAALEWLDVWNVQGVELHEPPVVQALDLQDGPQGDNFAGLSVGAAAEGGDSADGSCECQHGSELAVADLGEIILIELMLDGLKLGKGFGFET